MYIYIHPFLEFFKPHSPQLYSISVSLIVSKYFNLYKTLLWPYYECYHRMVVLSIRKTN